MIDLMVLRHMSERTIEAYIRHLKQLARHYGRCPSSLSSKEVEAYLVYLSRERGLACNTINVAAMAARFLFREVLGRSEEEFHLPRRKSEKHLPLILSLEEAQRLLNAPDRVKPRAILHTIYGCGLRLGEVVRLRLLDVESAHMRVRVEQSKGRKDRYTVLPQSTLRLLREYYRAERPREWLFNGRVRGEPISPRAIQVIYAQARKKAGIRRGCGVHTLRHCFASHHLALGTDLRILQEMLGHRHLSTTEVYLHVMPRRWGMLRSPADA